MDWWKDTNPKPPVKHFFFFFLRKFLCFCHGTVKACKLFPSQNVPSDSHWVRLLKFAKRFEEEEEEVYIGNPAFSTLRLVSVPFPPGTFHRPELRQLFTGTAQLLTVTPTGWRPQRAPRRRPSARELGRSELGRLFEIFRNIRRTSGRHQDTIQMGGILKASADGRLSDV